MTAIAASETPAAAPNRAARARPTERRANNTNTVTAAPRDSRAAHQSTVLAFAPPVGRGWARIRNTDRPTTTAPTLIHSKGVIAESDHSAARPMVNSNDTVITGCTTTSDPVRRAMT